MKAIAKTNTSSNIKPMDGSAQLGVLTGGQYVYGDLSTAGTDIINFSHYYKADGTKVLLAKKCKVFIGNNLILSNEVEPPDVPDPDPTPTFPEWFDIIDPQGNKARYEFVRIVTE